MMYYPEMNEKAAPRLFKTSICRNYYSIEWLPADNATARETFKRLRIRPSYMKFNRIGIELVAEAKSDRWTALISYGAHDKIMAADLTACEMLLD